MSVPTPMAKEILWCAEDRSEQGRLRKSKLRQETVLNRATYALFIFVSILLGVEAAQASEFSSEVVKADLQSAYGKLPMTFEANHGQTDSQVKFLTHSSGYALFLTPTETVLALRRHATKNAADPVKSRPTVLRMKLIGANPSSSVRGLGELPGQANYFIGKDPDKWRTNVSLYAKVEYQDLYPGVNLVYYGRQQQLEYDFVLAPGANAKIITLDFQGADKLEVDTLGNLVLHVAGGEIRMEKPLIYQEVNGVRQEIAGGYVLKDPHQVGFQVGHYDAGRPLVIDPTLFYSTYLGGADEDQSFGIAVDSSGNAYVTGFAASVNFPTTSGAFQTSFGGVEDVFVTKLNPTGSGLVYSTYLGGSGQDRGRDIAVDVSGNAYVTGHASTNFPTTPGAFKTALGGALQNAFVTKLNSTGSGLVYSTYLGGSNIDIAFALTIDVSGHAYVTGKASSVDFPTTSGVYEPVMLGSGGSAFITKLNPTGSGLVYSTFLSAPLDISTGFGIAADTSGNTYVTGITASGSFPTTPGAFQTTFNGGGNDAFVTKLDSTGSGLVYSTFLGGNASDNVHDLALDGSNHAYVTGQTNSANFPTTTGAFQTAFNGVADVFVTKVNPSGTGVIYSTFIGGTDNDDGVSLAVDMSNNVYITGTAGSSNFPTTPGGFQTAIAGGGPDAFVTTLNSTGAGLVYSTYLGGNGGEQGRGIALDQFANAYVTGATSSTNFPTTSGAFQTTFGGATDDSFVAKIMDIVLPPTTAGKVTGGGTINVAGGIGNFGFIVQRDVAGGQVDGHLTYNNHASGAKVRSTAFTALTMTTTTATFGGTCTNNGVSCAFTVTVEDNGEPGTTDKFTISVSGGPPEGGPLRSGNIQIHQ